LLRHVSLFVPENNHIYGQIHPNLTELWSYISQNTELPDEIKIQLKPLYETRKNYRKYIEDQTLSSHTYILYTTIVPIIAQEIESLENTGVEFATLAKYGDKKHQQLLLSFRKDISVAIKSLTELKSILETEQMYMRNLMDLSATISAPQRFRLDLIIPGRRFLQSILADFYTISNGKLKPCSQILVFLFNDMLVFAEGKGKEPKRLSTNVHPQIFRSPKFKKHKIIDNIFLDHITVKLKVFGSDNIVELSSPGKRVIIGMSDTTGLQEWVKTLNNQINFIKQQKSIENITIINEDQKTKRERKSNFKNSEKDTKQKSIEVIKTKLSDKGEEKV